MAINEGLTFAVALYGALAGSVSAGAAAINAYRNRQRLVISSGVTTTTARVGVPYIDIYNDSPRATTIREIGLYAKEIDFETESGYTGRAAAKYPFGGPAFLEAGEAKRFEGYPDIDLFGIHVDFPLRAYATDPRGRSTWGSAGPVLRWVFGPNPPLEESDGEDLKALFGPLPAPLLPARVEPRWKVWKRRELRKPDAWKSPRRG